MFDFGKDADGDLKKYSKKRDDLQAGRTPRNRSGELLRRGFAKRFLNAKEALRYMRLPTFGGHEDNGVDSVQGVHRWQASVRFTRQSSNSRPSR